VKETVVANAEEPVTVIIEEEAVDAVWVFYDETGCADVWGMNNVSEQEKLINIENYLNDLNVNVFELEIAEDRPPEDCFACSCKTGFVIKCKINPEDLNQLIAEDFYQ
jgi:hypothetical protein